MSATAASEAADLAEAQAGSHEAFARLYDRHAAVVLSVCRMRLHHHAASDADDCCQETFIRAFDRLDHVADPARLRSWLYAIARRVCSERMRATGRRRKHEMNASEYNASHNRFVGGALDQAARSETQNDLSQALAQLPDRERLAIHLYYLDPDPVSAARDALGISRSGFYKLLNRAKEQLALLLTGADAVAS